MSAVSRLDGNDIEKIFGQNCMRKAEHGRRAGKVNTVYKVQLVPKQLFSRSYKN